MSINYETGEVVEFDRGAAERRAERITLRLDAIADNYRAVLPMIREAIDAVEDARYRELLELRYIVGMRWERIAVEMNYNYDRIRHMHGEALRAVKVPNEGGINND